MWVWLWEEFTSADLLLFLCICTKLLCGLFILGTDMCSRGLGLQGTTSVDCLFSSCDRIWNLRLPWVYTFCHFLFFWGFRKIDITIKNSPSLNHYGTLAANYPENVFLVTHSTILLTSKEQQAWLASWWRFIQVSWVCVCVCVQVCPFCSSSAGSEGKKRWGLFSWLHISLSLIGSISEAKAN